MNMKSRKMVLMSPLAAHSGDADIEIRLVDTRREGETETNGESSMKTYISPYIK